MPPPPSHTTTMGSAMRAIGLIHAALVSRRAMPWPPAQAMSTTALWPRWMPSRCTTSWTCPSIGYGGHRLQQARYAGAGTAQVSGTPAVCVLT